MQNNLSIVSHIKNDIEFLEQYWKHIHVYEPKEIIILDTGSTDGTWIKLQTLQRSQNVNYIFQQYPHYTGQVHLFNKLVEMASSEWVLKIDTDELYKHDTVCKILDTIEENKYDCISLPTIHHFISSDLFFNCIEQYPDYHQRIFKREVFDENKEVNSKNHGSLVWTRPLNILTLGLDYSMFHYSFLKSPKKIQKRAIVNYFIDVEKRTDSNLLKNVDENIEYHIEQFKILNPKLTPVWQTEPTLIHFNDLEDYYIAQFLKWGKKVYFEKPEDLIVNKTSDWGLAEKIITEKLFQE